MPVHVTSSGDDEPKPDEDESPRMYVQRLAIHKAKYAIGIVKSHRERQEVVLGADTSVVIDGDILGKPIDAAEAMRMLNRLRGRAHEVITGIALIDAATGMCSSAAKASKVHMRDYSDEEIAAYIESGEPFDKAGAYAAQDETFMPAERIEGCYFNVIGLPICDVLTLLERIGVPSALRQGWNILPGCPDCDYWAEISNGAREVNRT